MYRLILRGAIICTLGLVISACAGNDPELKTQGNLDGIHYKNPNISSGSGNYANDTTFTPQEQEPQNIITSEIKLLYINTAPFKFYDYARLNTYQSGLVKLELFKYAQTIGSIRLKSGKMCVLTECSFKWVISKKFFGAVSYGDLFEDIVFGRDIFGGKGKQVAGKDIVVQRFQQSGEMIYYERQPGHILFKNMTTGVTIGVDSYEPLAIDNGVRNSLAIPQ